MKRIAIAASALAAIAFSTAALASTAVTGKYRATITKPASVAATYTLEFAKSGKVKVFVNGEARALGGSLKGSTFTAAGGKKCPTAGTYKVKLTGKKLTFTVIKDSCKVGRKLILPGHTFIKVG